MFHPLVQAHVVTGVIGGILPLYILLVLREKLDINKLKFIRFISVTSFVSMIVSWITAGVYYVEIYGKIVRDPVMTVRPWVHLILMETKEHLFLILPFLSFLVMILTLSTLDNYNKKILKFSIISIFVITLYMCLAGFVISQTRIEAGVLSI